MPWTVVALITFSKDVNSVEFVPFIFRPSGRGYFTIMIVIYTSTQRMMMSPVESLNILLTTLLTKTTNKKTLVRLFSDRPQSIALFKIGQGAKSGGMPQSTT